MHALRFYISVSVLGGSLLMTACNDDNDEPNDTVTTRSSATADFKSIKTFAISDKDSVPSSVAKVIPSSVGTNLDAVNDAVRNALEDQGLTEVNNDDHPDVVAFSLAATSNQQALSWDCVDGYWYGYWAYSWDPCAWLEPVYTEYTQGSVVIGLADPTQESVVFGGLIQGALDESLDSEESQQRLQDDVNQVFDAYPADQSGS